MTRTLKGLDMVVFQALQRETGNTKVRAVLDARGFEEAALDGLWDDMWDHCRDKSHGSAGVCECDTVFSKRFKDKDATSTSTYLTQTLIPTQISRADDEAYYLDPEKILLDHVHGQRRSESVVWLNARPTKFDELAAAYIAVSSMLGRVISLPVHSMEIMQRLVLTTQLLSLLHIYNQLINGL